MDKLIECRNKIDAIDTEIIKLFEKRMDIVKEVSLYKIEHNMPIFDASRENAMLKKNISKIENPNYKAYYPDVLIGYLASSKKMQNDIISNFNKKD